MLKTEKVPNVRCKYIVIDLAAEDRGKYYKAFSACR